MRSMGSFMSPPRRTVGFERARRSNQKVLPWLEHPRQSWVHEYRNTLGLSSSRFRPSGKELRDAPESRSPVRAWFGHGSNGGRGCSDDGARQDTTPRPQRRTDQVVGGSNQEPPRSNESADRSPGSTNPIA